MKNLILFGMVSFLGLQTQAQQIAADVQGIMNPPVHAAAPTGRELIQSDVAGILQTKVAPAGLQFKLQPGHYVIGSEKSQTELFSLFVQQSVNDPNQYVALLLNNEVTHQWDAGFTTMGRLYMGRPIERGTKLMLSPVHLADGKLLDDGKEDRQAPVILISLKSTIDGKNYPHFPYLIEEVHGTLHGEMLGMAGSEARINLMTNQTSYSFHSQGEEVVVSGDQMTQMVSGSVARQFSMNEYNGDVTPIFALTDSDLDTVEEATTSDIAVKKIAFFLQPKDCNQSSCGVLIIGDDIGSGLDWQMKVYKPHETTSFLERFFIKLFHISGNLAPKNSAW